MALLVPKLCPEPTQDGTSAESATEPRAPDRGDGLEYTFREYAPFVARLASSILSADDVEDLVQDVFLDALRGLRNLRDPAAVRAWLATVTVRKARRRLAPRGFRRFLNRDRDGAEAAERAAGRGISPEDAAVLARLRSALRRLGPDERIAWSLRHIEELTLPEIATVCDCSLATVKRRVRAAADKLREEVGRG